MNTNPETPIEFSPGISLIIPMCGRISLLGQLLNSILRARSVCQGVNLEVIVVWDGDDDPAELLRSFSIECNIPTQAVYLNATQSHKRNYGLDVSTNEILLYVDDDCTIDSNLIREVSKLFRNENVIAATVPIRFPEPTGFLEKATERMPYRQAYSWAQYGMSLWWAPAATLALRRSAVLKFGGFRTLATKRERAEDVDIGLRWSDQLGHPAITAIPGCASLHTPETWASWPVMIERAWRFGTSEGYLYLVHPSYRYLQMPSWLLLSLIILVISTILFSLNISWLSTCLLGIYLLIIWLALELTRAHKSKVPLLELPIVVCFSFIYELSRSLTLLIRAKQIARGVWFHEYQAKGSFWLLSQSGWYLIIASFLLLILQYFI